MDKLRNMSDSWKDFCKTILQENPHYYKTYRHPQSIYVYKTKELGELKNVIQRLRIEVNYEKDKFKLATIKDKIRHLTERRNELLKHDSKVIKIIDEVEYRNILRSYYTKAREVIIKGDRFYFGKGLGYLKLEAITRNSKKSLTRIDHGKTKILKKKLLAEGKTLWSKDNPEGEKYLIYYTDDYYPKVAWRKGSVKNIYFYDFKLVGDGRDGGSKSLIINAVHKDPSLRAKVLKPFKKHGI